MPSHKYTSMTLSFLISLTFLATPPAVATHGVLCGDGIVDGDEECDDGGLLDLDGCTRECRYEAVQRIGTLALQATSGPGFCQPATNALGSAFTGVGLSSFNDSLQEGIDTDQLIVLFDLLGLDTADGQNDADVEVGVLGGVRDGADPSPVGIDSWYLAGQALLDGDDMPTERLTPGAISALELSAGPSDVFLPFVDVSLKLRSAHLEALVDSTTSLPEPPPSQVAPGLLAFETLDGSGAADGLCGNVTVGSLATVPVPESVTSGATPCLDCAGQSRIYTSCGVGPVTASCHSLLDLVVGGCQVVSCGVINVISPTQPDVGIGANPPNALVFGASGGGIDKVIIVEADDAYSSWFSLTSERVHITNNLGLVFRDGFETGDTGGWSSATP
ncbi:MAG: DUF4215 domain-containing protein [Thermoanaerobaculia bacterium]|nr:DUF4215 domain-containing protein [Thermoanaerobaculia bacterium]